MDCRVLERYYNDFNITNGNGNEIVSNTREERSAIYNPNHKGWWISSDWELMIGKR